MKTKAKQKWIKTVKAL